MTRVMLRRTMKLANETQQIQIEIDEPQSVATNDYSCDCRILVGSHVAASVNVPGADQIQAVMIAFDAIREQLKQHFPTATWLGHPVDVSFPRTIPYMAGYDTYKEIETMADKHIESKYLRP